MQNIRKYLGDLISKNEETWWNPGAFKKIVLPLIPSEVNVLELPPKEDENYNCFIYVLGLSDDKKILSDSNGFIYSAFLEKLINKKEVEITFKPSPGDLILYQNPPKFGEEITHVGILQKDGAVISKWSWGPIVKHNVLDIPDFYGDKTSYLKAISKNKAQELYWQYRKFNKKP